MSTAINTESCDVMPIFDKFSKELISKYKTKSLFFEYFIHILLTVTIPVLMLIFVLLSVMLDYSFSKKQYLLILPVITSIENPNVQDNIPDKNELYYLIQKTKSIATEKISIENELMEKVAHLKKAQAITLQTQITPHFLFNTLNMITYSILDYSKEDTPSVRMIALLSDVLRYFLKTEATK